MYKKVVTILSIVFVISFLKIGNVYGGEIKQHFKRVVTEEDEAKFMAKLQNIKHYSSPPVMEAQSELGRTWYDYATNEQMGRMMAYALNSTNGQDGIHFVFMRLLPQGAQRYVTYDYYDLTIKVFYGNLYVTQVEPSGWGRVLNGDNDEAIICHHTSTLGTFLWQDDFEAAYNFNQIINVPGPLGPVFPGIAKMGNNVVFMCQLDNANYTGGDTVLVSTDNMQTWTGHNIIPRDPLATDLGSEFWPEFNPLNNNEFSHVYSQNVSAIAPNGETRLATTTDLGATWSSIQILDDDELIGPDQTQYIAENFGQYCGMYTQDGNYHVVIGAVQGIASPASTQIDIFPILYWNRNDDVFIELTDLEHGRPSDPNIQTALVDFRPGNGLGNAYPQLAEGPNPDELICIWQQWEDDGSGGIVTQIVPPGLEIFMTDIWGAYSNNGGQSWSAPFFVAGTPGQSDVYPNIARNFTWNAAHDSIILDIAYMYDTNASVSLPNFSNATDPSECIWYYKRCSISPIQGPDITISDDTLNYGGVSIGASVTDTLIVTNSGNQLLTVNDISTNNPDYTVNITNFNLNPGQSHGVLVTFTPVTTGASIGTLTITSNDPVEPNVFVAMLGEGVLPPDISVTPDSLSDSLLTGEMSTHLLTINNSGSGNLYWQISMSFAQDYSVLASSPHFKSRKQLAKKNEISTSFPHRPTMDDIFVFNKFYSQTLRNEKSFAERPDHIKLQQNANPLENILQNLNSNYQNVNGIIPNRFDFSEGETGNSIIDGDNDMYDGGNYLGTNLGGYIDYSNDVITTSPYVGSNGRYFTRKYPGLFVFAADLDGVDYFEITGNLGADGAGDVDGAILQTSLHGITYYGFVKRVYNAGDPSVNHLIIVPENSAANHEFSMDTNDDYHRVFNLAGTPRIYYLLYAGQNGFYIDNTATMNIMNAFLSSLGLMPLWLSANPDSGTVIPGNSTNVDIQFNATGLSSGDYEADILINSNDPNEPVVIVPTHLQVTGAPNISVDSDTLDFGQIFIGATDTLELVVTNTGTEDLLITSATANPTEYGVSPSFAGIHPEESKSFMVSFAPSAVGNYPGTLTFTSNDPDSSNYIVTLTGQGVEPPIISISPDSLNAALFTGDTTIQTLTIFNTGFSDLEWTINIEGIGLGTVTFTKPDYGDWTDPANQDWITENVHITRADNQGIFNAVTETGYSYGSPDNTEWAFGYTANLDSNDYQIWVDAVNHNPPSMVGQPMSLHLITDDKYFDMMFHSWTSGSNGGGFSYTRTSVEPQWFRVAQDSGIVPAGSSVNIDVTFDATGLFGGDYFAEIIINSNDPVTPEVNVPVYLDVTGAPDITVKLAPYDSTSIIYWNTSDATTIHTFHTPFASASDGELTVTIDGDYDLSTEYADIYIEGDLIGTINPNVTGPTTQMFTITEPDLNNYISDGTVVVTVDNSPQVDPGYGNDFHSVRLTYPGAVDTLDFDEVFVNYEESREIIIENRGTDSLDVSSITVNNAAFTVFPSSISIPYGEEDTVVVSFLPPTVGSYAGVISIVSNDPDQGLIEIPVAGDGIEPPIISVTPDSLIADLFTGDTTTQTLTISNTGNSDLNWAITLEYISLDTVTFTKQDYADWTDPTNQDWITDNVHITRADNHGIFNAVTETGYSYGSPDNTEWAFGYTANLDSNDYQIWVDAVNYNPPSMVGQPMSLHLIADDKYFDMMFHSWTSGNSGGGFSYTRTDVNPQWLAVLQESGIVPAGSSVDIDVAFDATGLFGGDYIGEIIVNSNDPATPEVSVRVHLNVTGAPDIALSPDSIDFGDTFVGYGKTDTLTVMNEGTDSLIVSNITTSDTAFSVNITNFFILPGEEALVLVNFMPPDAFQYSGFLTITSNDSDEITLNVPLSGTGIYPPNILVSPDSISAIVEEGDSTTKSMTIRNSGAGNLDWTIEITGGSAYTPSSSSQKRLTKRFQAIGAQDIQWKGNKVTYRMEGDQIVDGETRSYAIERTINLTNQLDNIHVLFADYGWSSFQIELEASGALTSVFSGSITPAVLDTIDVLVIDDGFFPSSTEITVVHNWINGGGGLIIDADEDLTNFNNIIAGSGITYVNSSGASGITTDITPHPTTHNIFSYEIGGSALASPSVTGNALDVIRDISGVPHVAVASLGAGRVVAVADEDLHDTSLLFIGHLDLGLNSVGWLAIPEWCTLSQNSGTVLPDDSVSLEVKLNAANLSAGSYNAALEISSNDPLNPTVTLPVHLRVDPSTAIENPFANQIPKEYVLFQNYPNPFNPTTNIRFGLPKTGDVRIELFNTLGQRVAVIIDRRKPVGYHVINFDASEFASGLYFYRIKAGDFQKVRKMLLLK